MHPSRGMDELTVEGTTVFLKTFSDSVNMHLVSFVIFVNFSLLSLHATLKNSIWEASLLMPMTLDLVTIHGCKMLFSAELNSETAKCRSHKMMIELA